MKNKQRLSRAVIPSTFRVANYSSSCNFTWTPVTLPSVKNPTKTINFHFSKAVFTLKNYRCLTEFLRNQKFLSIQEKFRYCKKTDTVKTEPRFNFFQVQTAVYRYISKPFHHYHPCSKFMSSFLLKFSC